MSYTKHNFQPGGTIQAAPFNSMEDQIALNESDIASLDERVQALESAPVGPGGISAALKSALLQLAEKVGYIDQSGPDCYQDLYDALYVNTQIASITAVLDLDGYAVTAGDSLDTLRPYLTVTVVYDDESQRTVSDYTLSGTIVVGINTITVSYEGETDTFTVLGNVPSDIPTGYTEIPSLYCAGDRTVYLRTGVMSGDIDYAEYSIMPMALRYLKAGHVVCTAGHYFPYLTGDNTNGERSRIGFKNRGTDDSGVSSGSYLFPWNFNERHTLMGFVDGGKVFVDGNELFTVPAGSGASSEIMVFAAPDADRYFIGRLYWLKFYKNGSVYRNYVPVKNESGTVGLYETVTGTFIYDTSGTGVIREGGE